MNKTKNILGDIYGSGGFSPALKERWSFAVKFHNIHINRHSLRPLLLWW